MNHESDKPAVCEIRKIVTVEKLLNENFMSQVLLGEM